MFLTSRRLRPALMSLLALGACQSQPSTPRDTTDARRYTTEGALDIKETVTATVTDPSSFLHPERTQKEGFKLDWSTTLMGNERTRNLWLFKDTVLIETQSHQLHSLDRFTGHYKWVIQLNNALDFAPTFTESSVSKNRMFYAIAQNNLYCIDAARTITGRELGVLRWKFPIPLTPSTPPHANEYFVALGVEERNYVATVLANTVDNKDHVPQVISWKRPLNGHLTATPASSSDREDATLMVATGEGTIYGLIFNTGERLWEFPGSYRAGPFRAPLLIHGNNIFAANEDHTLYILDRGSGGLLGKTVLDSSLSQAPWVVGDLNIVKDDTNGDIVRIDNDMDIFIQSDPSLEHPGGIFYLIHVDDIVIRDEDIIDVKDGDQSVTIKRRWLLKTTWKLEGDFDYLFRTRSRVFLRQGSDIVVVRRKDGEIVRRIDLGSTPLKIHYDPTSNYDENRLFVATNEGGIFSLEFD